MTAVKTKTPERLTPAQAWHVDFLVRLPARKLARYTDGGPSDLNRSRKRAAGKRQRQARKAQRS